jgi:hypothetical protein
MQNLLAIHLFDTRSAVHGRPIIDISTGPRGEVYLLTLEPVVDDIVLHRSSAGFGRSLAAPLHQYCITTVLPEDAASRLGADDLTLALPSTAESFNFVERLSEDRWLLVRARCDKPGEYNAHIFTNRGEEVKSFHAGDGIRDMRASGDGRIWVSYFDEGVCSGHKPESAGLACFDWNGKLMWDYAKLTEERREVPVIDDCYALNVDSNNDVWLYYSSGFPLVHLTNSKLTGLWRNLPVRGASAFAVSAAGANGKALFAGAYRQRDQLFLLSLDDAQVEDVQPVDREGRSVEFRSALGHGPLLYLIAENDVFVIRLDES